MESVPSKEKKNAWDSVSSGERDITLLRKVCVGKAVVFPGVMCVCESWT